MKKSIFHVAVLGLLTSIAAISCDDNTDVCQEHILTQDEINESIYQRIRNNYCAEELLNLSKLYGYSISDVMRIYQRQKSEKPGGIYIKDTEAFEQYILEQILQLGFRLENYRWIYKDMPVIMGEFYHNYQNIVKK